VVRSGGIHRSNLDAGIGLRWVGVARVRMAALNRSALNANVPPHGCGATHDGPLCHMNLDGTCPVKSCAYYVPPPKDASASKGSV
jgi:hypothetical protein